jgi:hypothetical protein
MLEVWRRKVVIALMICEQFDDIVVAAHQGIAA